jgi:protocatechuate 3,4-dioxygenase, beta subunit
MLIQTASTRRRFLAAMAASGAFFTERGAFAQALTLTPAQTEGPYYPDQLPLDQDNDLLLINDSINPGVGEVAWLSGRVLDRNGAPVRGALVELWQADIRGSYIHSRGSNGNAARDANFQGYGRFQTAGNGTYLFRTIRPGLYTGRTRHAHMKVRLPGGRTLTTQLYIEGDPNNAGDGVLNGIGNAAQRAAVTRPWTVIPGSPINALAVAFDIVLDYTPAENPAPVRPTLVSMYGVDNGNRAKAGVVNGASFETGIAAGAWVTLYGDALSATTRTWAAADIVNNRLPESLDGVSVRINNQPAPVYYVSPKQINVLAPDVAPGAAVEITVTNSAGASAAVTAEAKTFMPAFFQFPNEHVAATHANGALLGPAGLIEGAATTPARPGDTIVLYGTGFGPSSPSVAANQAVTQPAPLANNVVVRIDGIAADIRFAGLTASGLVQINAVVPAQLADGDHSLTAEIGGARTAKSLRIATQRQTAAAVRPTRSDKRTLRKFLAVQG